MTQGFVFGQPVTREGLISQFVRANFDAVGSLNAGDTAPENPQEGMPWLDTSEAPTIFRLKVYLAGVFQVMAVFPVVLADTVSARIVIGVPAVTWTLVHNFGQPTVSVTLFDLTGKMIEALDVDVTDVNQAIVTHAYPVAGAALVVG